MASLNKVLLIGNLGKDPEVKYLPSGIKVAKFSLATAERFKSGDDWEEKTEWHNITCFNKLAERAGDQLKKGTNIYIEGRISTSSWEVDGEKKYRTEIIANSLLVLGNRKENPNAQNFNNQGVAENPSHNQDVDDDLPF
ncbi:MAG: single-stranded DNA-binding protein [Candidatus Delongbacteria bacterium]|nr:single-stranded DNA-binding protein [Candidatus Delongbacteria bacterium]MBN2835020.1 single-stranded DNA-binding protein [Candidatus Delongbacteria bacterium]